MTGHTATIGFVGLGAIGTPMARRIGEAGHALVVHDISPAAMQPFAGQAKLAASAKEVADAADIVFVCLATLAAHHDVILGENGIAAGKAVRICVITSTTGPALVREMAAALAGRNITIVDAPMTGGRIRAAEGTLTVMLSGAPEATAVVEPVLRCYGSRVVGFGPEPGTAQTMKLINNIMSAVNFGISCEALVFGAKAGLPPESMMEVINNGTGKNDASLTMIPRNVLTRSFDFGSVIAVSIKDMTQAVEEAERLGVPVALTRCILQMFKDATLHVREEDDQTMLVRALEIAADTQIPKSR